MMEIKKNMSEVAQLVEHEKKRDHVCDPNSNFYSTSNGVIDSSNLSLTLTAKIWKGVRK